MNRREFLTGLGAATAALILDPVTGLYVPRSKIWAVSQAIGLPAREDWSILAREMIEVQPMAEAGTASMAALMIELGDRMKWDMAAELRRPEVWLWTGTQLESAR